MAKQPKPPSPHALSKFKEGLAHHQQGRLQQAEALYLAAHRLDKEFADALHHLGIIALQTNRLNDAIGLIRQSIKLDPSDPGAYNNLGMALEDTRQPVLALEAYGNALHLNPDHIEALLNRGNVLQTLNRWDQALGDYDRIIKLAPNYPDAYNNRGNVLRTLGRHREAIISFDRAIALNPGYVQAFNNKGIALKDLNQLHEALNCYDRALSMQPNYSDALSNRAIALKELGQPDRALQDFDRAIALNPVNAQAYANRGGLFQELGKNDLALRDYQKALDLDATLLPLYGKRLHVQMLLCDWTDFDSRRDQITSLLMGGEPAADPFTTLTFVDSLLVQKASAQLAIKLHAPENKKLGLIKRDKFGLKIRLGYFSADFRDHPVAYLMAELFEKHDKSRFELFAFSLGRPTQDVMRQRIASAFDHFIEVGSKSDEDIAKLARSHGIDIAIDLGGFTMGNRIGVFAYRTAPVQVQYIGYLGTMGAPYIDYILADRELIPEANQNGYVEKIAYLPSYQANDSLRQISERIFSRKELGLPEDAFVFCCFNNTYKITPDTFDSWMRILSIATNSVLFLFANNVQTQDNLKKEANRRGIDPTRLIFGQRLERDEYLARFRCADLFLDTLPYNAGTTASDALWAGLPVLTLSGESFAARMCASVLKAIGLPELITSSTLEYEAKAIELVKNPELLQSIKHKLSVNKHSTALFDTGTFCQSLEMAYQTMHERSRSDLLPCTFSVKSQ